MEHLNKEQSKETAAIPPSLSSVVELGLFVANMGPNVTVKWDECGNFVICGPRPFSTRYTSPAKAIAEYETLRKEYDSKVHIVRPAP